MEKYVVLDYSTELKCDIVKKGIFGSVEKVNDIYLDYGYMYSKKKVMLFEEVEPFIHNIRKKMLADYSKNKEIIDKRFKNGKTFYFYCKSRDELIKGCAWSGLRVEIDFKIKNVCDYNVKDLIQFTDLDTLLKLIDNRTKLIKTLKEGLE